MNKKILFCLISFLILQISYNLHAQNLTIAGATLTGDVFWKGNITVAGDVTIAKNGRLIIEPGARIKFAANSDVARSGSDKTRSELIVRGVLIAQGNKSRRIIFSSNEDSPRMGDWYGIQFLHNQTQSTLDYCTIEYAFNGVTIKNNNLQISNSEIRYNYNSGIRTEVKARPQIIQNIITGNGYAGVVCELGSAPLLRDNLIAQNPIGMVILSLSEPNLGSLNQGKNYNPGRNRFANNEEYDIYNHSTKTISAQNNTWSSENRKEIAGKIYDRSDNSKYGTISLTPIFGERQRESNLNRLLVLAQNTADTGFGSGDPASEIQEETNPLGDLPQDTVSTNPDAEKPIVADQIISDAEPLLASTRQNHLMDEQHGRDEINADIMQIEINYDQIFMEPFLDQRRKEFIRKEQFLVTESVRQVMEAGEIRIKVVVGKNGEVESATILKGINSMLDNAVLETVKKYRYKSGQVNGKSVRFSTNEVFRFQ